MRFSIALQVLNLILVWASKCPERALKSRKVALLVVGLVRGIQDSGHREWLQQLVGTLGLPVEVKVFGWLEISSTEDVKKHFGRNGKNITIESKNCSEYDVKEHFQKIFGTYESVLKLEHEDDNNYFLPEFQNYRPWQMLQFQKTNFAFRMVHEYETFYKMRFDWVLRIRFDSSGKLSCSWFDDAVSQLAKYDHPTVLANNDYVWLADRESAEFMCDDVWKYILAFLNRIKQAKKNARKTQREVLRQGRNEAGEMLWGIYEQEKWVIESLFPIDWCRVARSSWAHSCSNFLKYIYFPDMKGGSKYAITSQNCEEIMILEKNLDYSSEKRHCSLCENTRPLTNPQVALGALFFQIRQHNGSKEAPLLQCLRSGSPIDLWLGSHREERHTILCR